MATTLKQGDTAPILELTLKLSGSAQDLTGYQSVTFRMFDEYENIVIEDDDTGNVNVTDAQGGVVEYVWQDGDTSDVGEYEAEFVVVFDDGSDMSFPNDSFLDVVIHE